MHRLAVFRLAAVLSLACGAASPVVSPARADSCPAAGTELVVLAAIAPRLELELADGRLLRLAGLEPAAGTATTPDRDTIGIAALSALIDHHALAVTILSQKPDRWGRLTAFASVGDGPAAGEAGGLAAAALAAGLARFHSEAAASACRATLLAAEDKARLARFGLWADPFYSVLAADDRAAIAERVGTDVVVEARLRAVEPGPYRTRLHLEASGRARSGSHDRLLEATIVPHAMKAFEARGVDVHSMIGHTLRLRGLLDRRFGPRIELAGPDEIEVLPETISPARSN